VGFLGLGVLYLTRKKKTAYSNLEYSDKIIELSEMGLNIKQESENKSTFFPMAEIEDLSIYYYSIEGFAKIIWFSSNKKFVTRIATRNESDLTKLKECLVFFYQLKIKFQEFTDESRSYMLFPVKKGIVDLEYEKLIAEIGKSEA
jgi:hypothetical protein